MQSRVRKAVGVAAGATALALSATTMAHAEVTQPLTPAQITWAGVGSDTTQKLMDAIGSAYNNVKKPLTPGKIQSFDATGSATISSHTAAACTGEARPNGSSAGISALLGDTNNCYQFARSSRVKKSDGTESSLAFFKYAIDAVTWSTNAGSAVAPASLTTGQLNAIYSCTDTFWSDVSPSLPHLAIKAYIPQNGSGTRAFFLSSIGLASPGACVNQAFEENEGNQWLADAGAQADQAIFPYSTAVYIAQKNGVQPDLRSTAELRPLNIGTIAKPKLVKSYSVNATTGAWKLNAKFPYHRDVFNVVKKSAAGGTVPSDLQILFGPIVKNAAGKVISGYVCTQSKLIVKFGFATEPSGTCGQQS
jgi:ABC-type phosphate transport system substrate-binding protein